MRKEQNTDGTHLFLVVPHELHKKKKEVNIDVSFIQVKQWNLMAMLQFFDRLKGHDFGVLSEYRLQCLSSADRRLRKEDQKVGGRRRKDWLFQRNQVRWRFQECIHCLHWRTLCWGETTGRGQEVHDTRGREGSSGPRGDPSPYWHRTGKGQKLNWDGGSRLIDSIQLVALPVSVKLKAREVWSWRTCRKRRKWTSSNKQGRMCGDHIVS